MDSLELYPADTVIKQVLSLVLITNLSHQNLNFTLSK